MDTTPEQAGRLHALQDLERDALARAQARRNASASVTSPHDLAYLTAYADTAEAVAKRARGSMESKA